MVIINSGSIHDKYDTFERQVTDKYGEVNVKFALIGKHDQSKYVNNTSFYMLFVDSDEIIYGSLVKKTWFANLFSSVKINKTNVRFICLDDMDLVVALKNPVALQVGYFTYDMNHFNMHFIKKRTKRSSLNR